MLHEFTVHIPYKKAEEMVENLNLVGLYNTYYEAPIEVETTSNGYDYEEKEDETIPFQVYIGEEEIDVKAVLHEQFSFPEEEIHYRFLTEEDLLGQAPSFEDIDLENGWMIAFPDFKTSYEGKRRLLLDPQGGFGTGLHGTTQDCVRFIVSQNLNGQSVLDLGTGSGILSIAASLVGARMVEAVDIEPVEREVLYNAGLNEVSNITVHQLDIMHTKGVITAQYDWIFVNIGGDEAVTIINAQQLLSKTSHILISGMVDWNTLVVEELLHDHGFQPIHRVQTEEWVTMAFQKMK